MDPATLQDALTTRPFVIAGEQFTSPLSRERSETVRNSLLAHIYALAFDWCVTKINESIARPKSEVSHTVGVLDIFGFENFSGKDQTNSFPQLCINLTNERLHALFIRHVFKVEQDMYEKEGIEWTVVDYHDNKDIIDLITHRPTTGKGDHSAMRTTWRCSPYAPRRRSQSSAPLTLWLSSEPQAASILRVAFLRLSTLLP